MVEGRLCSRRCSAIAIVSIAIMAACTDMPTAPATMNKVPVIRRDVSYASGSELVVVDQSGQKLRLVPSVGELRLDDGRVYIMSDTQMAEILSDFQATIAYDALASETESLPEPTCDGMFGCEEQSTRVLPVAPMIPRALKPKTADGRTSKYRLRVRANSGSGGFTRAHGFARPMSPTFDYITALPNCRSMKMDLIAAMAGFRNERAAVTQRWLATGLSGFAYEAGRWIKRITLPEGNAFFAAIQADMVNKKQAETKFDVMRVLYTSSGCGTINWASQSSGGSGGGGTWNSTGGGGYAMTCHPETWHVSFDSGETWRNVDATVCEYVMM